MHPSDTKKFQLTVSNAQLNDLQYRLQHSRLPVSPAGSPWQHGSSLSFMQSLLHHWQTQYNWREWEQRINSYQQFLMPYEHGELHYLIHHGSGNDPTPLLLSHGWPGSFIELINLIEPLAHPEKFGGKIDDAFTVIIPSLPGYGFSTPPHQLLSPREVAALWHQLMSDCLGFNRYMVHGGDMGSAISSWLALDFADAVIGLHLNNLVMQANWTLKKLPPTPQEQNYINRQTQRLQNETAYQMVHGTRPLTLAYSLSDSPLGLAAWICEKFYKWTVAEEGDAFTIDMDHLITNIMIYWLGDPGASTWMYNSLLDMSGFTLPEGRRIDVATGFCLFPNDIAIPPPDSWLQRGFNVQQCTRASAGGHFPAMECPNVLVEDIQQFRHTLQQ